MTSRRIGKASACFLACFLASGPLSFAQTQETVIPSGVSISHFAHIDAQVYVGSKPRTDEDFEFLQSQHIKYILNARFLPFLSGLEKRKAKRYGVTFLSVPMNASPIPPSQKHVNQILLTLKDPRFQPIYLHCVLGRDRTGLITGLYRIYLLKVSTREAWEEMRRSGFKTWWIVHGLTRTSTSTRRVLHRCLLPDWIESTRQIVHKIQVRLAAEVRDAPAAPRSRDNPGVGRCDILPAITAVSKARRSFAAHS